jgi:DNA-binding transcriptional ArsR family regulator
VEVFDVLAEPRRRRLVELCWHGERNVGELHGSMPDITLGAVSQHLARLRAAGLVEVRREGRHRYYRAVPEAFGPLRAALDAMWTASLDRLQALTRDAAPSDGSDLP